MEIEVPQDTKTEILKVLWLNSNNPGGMARGQILATLAERRVKGDVDPDTAISDSSIKKSLRDLKDHDPPLIVLTSVPGSHGREIYEINLPQVITWSSTAYFVLQICKLEEKAMQRDVFIEKMLTENIIDKTTDKKFTNEDLNEQLNFACSRQYLGLINNDRLVPGPRALSEVKYLSFVADHVRRIQAASSTGT